MTDQKPTGGGCLEVVPDRCPFCGGEADSVCGQYAGTGDDGRWWCSCLDCEACSWHFATEAEAVAAWNRRTDIRSGDPIVRKMFDEHQKMRAERDRAIGALLCAFWDGCLTFDRARELLGMTTLQLRAEAHRLLKRE